VQGWNRKHTLVAAAGSVLARLLMLAHGTVGNGYSNPTHFWPAQVSHPVTPFFTVVVRRRSSGTASPTCGGGESIWKQNDPGQNGFERPQFRSRVGWGGVQGAGLGAGVQGCGAGMEPKALPGNLGFPPLPYLLVFPLALHSLSTPPTPPPVIYPLYSRFASPPLLWQSQLLPNKIRQGANRGRWRSVPHGVWCMVNGERHGAWNGDGHRMMRRVLNGVM
jgi:hypothetical protein